jgi:tRNA A-37 threonylcarbamoyl transferase component Bud32
MEDLSGRTFGVYRVLEPLGRGGMASVYKAYQPAVDRHVALKVLPRHLAEDPKFLARFEQEAKILAKLQHPHILPVHDFGESDGFTYIVMPFIRTGTLTATLTGQPLPFDQIRRVITQIGDALDCAHAQGLVHRDVKPSNILLDERGNCLLADFGIAKMLKGADTLTATGSVIGTPQYMSPEQGMGTPIDGRSDIYSLGVVLYEMATGQLPFEAETPLAVVVKHIHDPLPLPNRVNPTIPESLHRMILRAMHKDPSERFPTANAMVAAMASTTEPTTGGGGVDTITASVAATDACISPAVANQHAAATASIATADQPRVAVDETSGMRRPVAIGAAVLVVLVLLFFLWPDDDPETESRQALSSGTPPISDAASAPQGDRIPRSIAEPADATTPASSTSIAQPTPEAGDDTQATAATVATGELLISVDVASSVTVDGTAVGRVQPGVPHTLTVPVGQHLIIATADDGVTRAQAVVDLSDGTRQVVVLELAVEIAERTEAAATITRENALRSAMARAEEDRLRRDAETAARDPFPDQGDGTFLDRQTGFLWTAEGSPGQGNDGLLWTNANTYCEGLTLGSTSNWRLPSREELDPVLQRLDPTRYSWGLSLWSTSRPFGESNRLWVTNSPLYAPEWSSAVRDVSARRLTHRAVCVARP